MRLTLLCHAPTAALRSAAFPADEPIDAQGLAAALVLRPAIRRPDEAFTSPARRATETVAALGLDASSCAALADVDHGRWAGRAFAEVATAEPEAVAAWLGDPDAAPHGGESLAALLARTRAWLQTLHAPAGARRHRVLAVTHAAVIRALVVQTLGAPPAAFWRIDVAPLTLTILRVKRSAGRSRPSGRSCGPDGPSRNGNRALY